MMGMSNFWPEKKFERFFIHQGFPQISKSPISVWTVLNLDGWKRNLARDNHPTIDLNFMWNQSTCLNASITLSKLPIMMQTQIRATNMRWGRTTLKSLQPFLVPMLNTTIHHSWLSHYNCQIEMWSLNLDDWKRNLARDNHPTNLNLMWNQSTCLNASITLSKLPIKMHTQIQATNMRWGEGQP